MSWPTVLWSMEAAACLTMAAVHLLVWLRNRGWWANLSFSVAAAAVAAIAFIELSAMYAQTPAQFSNLLRWARLPVFAMTVGLVAFVRSFLRTGRPWLGHAAWVARLLVVIVNFSLPENLNFREMTGLQHIDFLGERVAIAEGIRSSWPRLSELASLLMLVFVADAAIACWRRGDRDSRRKAVTVGGSIVAFMLLAPGLAALHSRELVQVPMFVSFPFLGIVLAMGYELTRDILRAGELSRELTEGQERMELAVHAGGLCPWTWDVRQGTVWGSESFAQLFGFPNGNPIDFAALISRIHPEDRAAAEAGMRHALETGEALEKEWRAVLPDGTERWISCSGKPAHDNRGEPLLRGVCIDVTERKRDDVEMELLRSEVAHAGRISVMGQLAAALAHELNQPLAAILRNAEAAELFVKRDPPDLEEVTAILEDICKDDRRASNIIANMRSLIERKETERSPVGMIDIVNEVLALTNTDALLRGVKLVVDREDSKLTVRGNRVQLQQVLLNLLLNSMDAVRDIPASARRVVVRTRRLNGTMVEVSVADAGHGVETEMLTKVFEPFVTTKSGGMGMGLAICKTLVEGHGGRIWVENNGDGGATFRFTIPVALPENVEESI